MYAGYATNMCILTRPTGIIKMKELGYNIILVRDATLAIETPESLDNEWAKKMSINLIETSFGKTTTLKDLKNSLKKI